MLKTGKFGRFTHLRETGNSLTDFGMAPRGSRLLLCRGRSPRCCAVFLKIDPISGESVHTMGFFRNAWRPPTPPSGGQPFIDRSNKRRIFCVTRWWRKRAWAGVIPSTSAISAIERPSNQCA